MVTLISDNDNMRNNIFLLVNYRMQESTANIRAANIFWKIQKNSISDDIRPGLSSMIAYVASDQDDIHDLVAGYENWRDLQRDNSGKITRILSVVNNYLSWKECVV